MRGQGIDRAYNLWLGMARIGLDWIRQERTGQRFNKGRNWHGRTNRVLYTHLEHTGSKFVSHTGEWGTQHQARYFYQLSTYLPT